MQEDPQPHYISLREAAKYSGCHSQDYLSLRARQGKLKAVKIARNWVTKREWIDEYLKKVQDFKNRKLVSQAVPQVKLFAIVVALIFIFIFILASLGSVFGYSTLEPTGKNVSDGVSLIIARVPEDISKNLFEPVKNLAANIATNLSQYISQDIRAIKKFAQNIPRTLLSTFKKLPQKIVTIFKNKPEIPEEILTQEEIEKLIVEKSISQEQLKEIQQTIEKLKEEGLPQKEIIKEVQRITQIQPEKIITKEIKTIGDKSLIQLKSQIAEIQAWEKDIQTLQTLTSKLQTHPPYTQVTTAPVYIGSQGIQIGGAATLASLGVSGSAGITNLGVGGSTSLGSDSSDKLTVNATADFLSPATFESSLTIGTGTTTLTLNNSGSVTSGIWQGTAIGPTYGGTGLTSYATGALIFATSTDTLAGLSIGSENQVLTVSSGKPTWAAAAGGGAGLWSTSTGITYLTATTSDIVMGASSTSSAPFWMDISSGDLTITGNLSSADSFLTSESDPIWVASSSDYYTSIEIDNEGYLTTVDMSDDTNFSVTATGLEESGDALALTGGYEIPLTASTTNWETAYAERGSQIAGTLLSWDGSVLNVNDDLSQYSNATSGFLTTVAYNDLTGNPSDRITAGTLINWSSDTLSVVEDLSQYDNSTSSFLTSYTESDPVWAASSSDYYTKTDLALTQGYIYIGDTSNEPTATSSLFVKENGNVGIGTTNPATKLTIVGTTTARTILPEAHNTYDLGSSANRWANIYAVTTTIGTGSLVIGQGGISSSEDLTISVGSNDIIITSTSTQFATTTIVGTIDVSGTIKESGTPLSDKYIPAPSNPQTGDILYYTGSAWDVLHATTTGLVLTSQGASTPPTWVSAAAEVSTGEITLPDPETGGFVTPAYKGTSSGVGPDSIISEANLAIQNLGKDMGYQRVAQKITLSGDQLSNVTVELKRGTTITGSAYVRVRKTSDDSIIETSTNVLDVSTLGTSWEDSNYDFPLSSSPNEEVYITVEYNGGDAENSLQVRICSSDNCSGVYTQWNGTWNDVTGYDMWIHIDFPGGPSSVTIDENMTTNWVPVPENEAGAWVSWDVDSLKVIGGCRIYWGAEAAYRPTEYKIYTSPDNSTWTEVIHETEVAPASAWKEYEWSAELIQYIKFVVVTHGASGTKIFEVDAYSLQAGDFVTPTYKDVSSGGLEPGQITNTVSDNPLNYTAIYTQIGQRIDLTGKKLTKVSWYLIETGGSPTGTMTGKVFKVSNGTLVGSSTTTIDASTVSSSWGWYETEFDLELPEECDIVLEWTNASIENSIALGRVTASDEISGDAVYGNGGRSVYSKDATIDIYYQTNDAEKSLDENLTTYWVPDPENEAGAWISWDIESLKYIGGCRIYWGAEEAYRPTEYKIYTSPDNSEWTEVVHETEAAPASAWKEYTWYAKYARYIKLVVTTHGSSGTKVYEVDEYSKSSEELLATHGHGGGADLAERFLIDSSCQEQNSCPEKGDLVKVNENQVIVKTDKPYQGELIGVVSSNPGLILSAGLNENNSRLVALAGRTPVKVSIENGPIEIGDPITSGSMSGVGMKATGAGRVVGLALEPYSSQGIGKIMIFINPHWVGYNLTVQENGEGQIVNLSPEGFRQSLASLGLQVTENGSLEVQELKAKKVVAEEFEIRDKATGEIWCTWIENGEWKRVKGNCEEISSPSANGTNETDTAPSTGGDSGASTGTGTDTDTGAETDTGEGATTSDETAIDEVTSDETVTEATTTEEETTTTEPTCQPQTFYLDADGDSYGVPDTATSSCEQPAGYMS